MVNYFDAFTSIRKIGLFIYSVVGAYLGSKVEDALLKDPRISLIALARKGSITIIGPIYLVTIELIELI